MFTTNSGRFISYYGREHTLDIQRQDGNNPTISTIDIAYLYQHSFRNILSVPLHLEHILMEYHINRIGHWSNQYSGH